MSNSSIWPIDRTLSCATTPGQSKPGSDGNEGVLRIPKSSSIIGASPSISLVLYPPLVGGGGSYSSAVMLSVYFAVPTDLVNLPKGGGLCLLRILVGDIVSTEVDLHRGWDYSTLCRTCGIYYFASDFASDMNLDTDFAADSYKFLHIYDKPNSGLKPKYFQWQWKLHARWPVHVSERETWKEKLNLF